ncbi:hypothetical protein A3Q56_04295 [Intoshia linei]|uniref:Uncharacterized protein n=1 Tax=Intoshia linei TaxID=1819745 RepID=A0A177B0Z5_9BILA|nr:hypothetical protein A3Q56_04295 [Intoshia linei]
MDICDELKNSIKNKLEKSGSLDQVKVQLKSDIFKLLCINETETENSIYQTDEHLKKFKDVDGIIHYMIHEYLNFKNYSSTESIFKSECIHNESTNVLEISNKLGIQIEKDTLQM